jgi:hypothetical protein
MKKCVNIFCVRLKRDKYEKLDSMKRMGEKNLAHQTKSISKTKR